MPIKRANIDALQQVRTLLLQINDDDYTHCNPLSSSAIGHHVRHALDHYWAVQQGLKDGLIHYDTRRRNSALESDRNLSLDLIEQCCEWLGSNLDLQQPCRIVNEVGLYHTESVTITSSLQRELCYLLNHTIHHTAYMVLLARSFGINTPQNLGLAPSTATYLRQQAGDQQEVNIR